MNMIKLIGAAVAGTICGWAASRLGMPLAWLIGSAIASAVINLSFGALSVPRSLYRAGQAVVGVSVGLTVTAAVFERIGPHLVLVPLLAIISILLGRLMVPLLVWASRLDSRTAYFALVPAGISEMADLAHAKGADSAAVATMHAVRVFLVVLVLPLVIFGLSGSVGPTVPKPPGAWDDQFALALVAGIIAGLIGNRLGMPSAFVVAPMVAVAALSASGLIAAREPASLLAAAQVLLGLSLGTRFRRTTVGRLPRALLAGSMVLLLNGVIMAALGLTAAAFLDFEPSLMLLASATGGTAEMVLTAQVVGADAALVAVYQVARGLGGNLLALPVHALTFGRGQEKPLQVAPSNDGRGKGRNDHGPSDQ